MVYHKLMVLPTICRSPASKLHNSIILSFIKRCLSYSSFRRLPQHETELTDATNGAKTIKDASDQIPLIFYKYLQNINPKFRDKILQNYLTLSLNDADPYLISREVGNNFVSLIKDDLLENMSHVIELNPGFGILTESLLQAGIPFINLYEKYDEFYPELYNLNNTFPNRVHIKRANLFKMSKILNLHGNCVPKPGTSLGELMDNISERKWEDKSCMQIIGATTKLIFIRHLIISVVFQTGFMMYGRPIFYLALPPSIWKKFTYDKKITTNRIMFHILFNYKIFGTLDRKGFIPWIRKRKANRNGRNHTVDDSEMLYVVKLEPKSDLFTLFDGKENMKYFWHFIRHHFYKPSLRVIPALEKLIPDCGVRLIEKNYTIFTEFGHLNPDQAYNLFMEFKSWPEFEGSTFLYSANDIKKTYDPYMEE
ncbi:mitochondrial transcription factor B2 [Xylocopa sonorina]|uniref:mitochondrial transcription factor B2 n=1 Tax=Xylocopa sonorina TaxID=1818115 RepID=UPI00403AC05E